MKNRLADRLCDALLLLLALAGGAGACALLAGIPLFRFAGARWAASPYGAYLPGDGVLLSRYLAAFLAGLGGLALVILSWPRGIDRALRVLVGVWQKIEAQGRGKRLLLLFLLALALGVYASSFQIGTHSDDYVWRLESQRSAADLRHVFSLSVSHFFKPLTHLFHLVNFRLFAGSPHLAHLGGFLLHGLNAFLLYLVVLALSRRKGMSFLAAVLFCVYSVSNRSVMWLSGSEITLGATFYLLTVHFYLAHLERENRRPLALALLFCVLGVLTKDAVITVVPTLVLIALFRKRSRLRLTVVLFGSVAALQVAVQFLIQSDSFLITEGIYRFQPALLLKNLCLYLFVSVVPQGHKLLVGFPPLRSLACLAVPVVLLLVFVRGTRLTRFFLLWDLLLLTPFLPFDLPVQPRYLYLPALALTPLLAGLLQYAWQNLFAKLEKGRPLFALLLVLVVAGNALIVHGAATRMAAESRHTEEYLASLRADRAKMAGIRRGTLPADSPLPLGHLVCALEVDHEE